MWSNRFPTWDPSTSLTPSISLRLCITELLRVAVPPPVRSDLRKGDSTYRNALVHFDALDGELGPLSQEVERAVSVADRGDDEQSVRAIEERVAAIEEIVNKLTEMNHAENKVTSHQWRTELLKLQRAVEQLRKTVSSNSPSVNNELGTRSKLQSSVFTPMDRRSRAALLNL